MEETTVAVVRVPWGKSPSWLNTTLLLSWGIHRGIGGSLLGTLIRVVTLHSTLETSDHLSFAATGTTLLRVIGAVLLLLLRLGGARLKLLALPEL